MDTILLAVTGISLAVAAVMGVLLTRMLRDERRRSDARIALLSELAAEPATAPAPLDSDAAPRHRVIEPPQRRVVERQQRPVIQSQSQPQHQTRPSRMLVLDDFDLHPTAEEVPGAHDLFHEPDEPSPWPRRFAVVGGLAAVIAAVVFGWSALPLGRGEPAPPSAQIAEVIVDTPLELLSLRHTQQDGMFTITGLVQNPRAGRELSGVKATLFVFGPGGSFITSGRAPLDFTALGPGDESPFVIRVPVTGDIARYRVGFRGDDNRVLAHVDRRPADAIAQK
jgi:hypothetical protein